MTKTNMFDINELIVKGRNLAKEYELPVGKVFVRPLTDLEMNEAEASVFTGIQDEYTRGYMLTSVFGDEAEKKKIDPTKIDIAELMKANTESNVLIAFMAMNDFTTDLTIEKVKMLPGIKDLADFVRKISGYNSDVEKTVEEFRKESSGKTA